MKFIDLNEIVINMKYIISAIKKRVINSLLVFIGKKKVVEDAPKKVEIVDRKQFFTHNEQSFIDSISMEFIFTEFGKNRVNAGGTEFNNEERIDPTFTSLKKYFPKAKYTVFTDFDLKIKGVNIMKVDSPVVDPENLRFGYRTGNYFKFKGLLESEADFKCALDSDMQILSSKIIVLIYMTQKFGFCVPHNVRQLLKRDMEISLDSQLITDESQGLGYSYNQSPMTLWKGDKRGEIYYKACKEIMKNEPSRGSLVMWKAAWKTGVYPYVLPKQWCVCSGDEGVGDEVILHIGHNSVANYYNIK